MPSYRADDWNNPPSDIFSCISQPRPRFRGRRSRVEMMVHVLGAVKGSPEKPTRIMYRSNLSWSVCQDILGHLVARGLVEVVPEDARKRYELTQAGTDVLSSFIRIAEAMGV